MPLHLPPSCSRREFVRKTILGGLTVLTYRTFAATAGAGDPHRWVLFSDPHIAADPAAVLREVRMADHLSTAVAAVTKAAQSGSKPAGLMINGDCAVTKGLPEDYATLEKLLAPLGEAGIPVHANLGNHDDRDTFWQVTRRRDAAGQSVASKHVSIVESERANWFMLDSLNIVNKVEGRLGDEQLRWLEQALDSRRDKPALVMMHHHPMAPTDAKQTGLLDSEQLLSVLLPRKHVKALIFGHTHTWKVEEREGLHLINLPALAYVFSEAAFSGWANCELETNGMTLELQAIDQKRPEHGRVVEFAWRT